MTVGANSNRTRTGTKGVRDRAENRNRTGNRGSNVVGRTPPGAALLDGIGRRLADSLARRLH
ncbi:hypothetical protein BRD01_14400 [Halobacteriales archaeon QS_8_65_32]|nr:MAG: hypothetical protein BRD01_14400 [Halobacteriales archaeon QS_8_65_32]